MKIDTSKLTPIQAQQIEAIASGTLFTIQTPRTAWSWFDGVSMELKTVLIKDSEFDDLISELVNVSPVGNPAMAAKRDDMVATMKKEASGIPVWHCQHIIRADDFTAMTSGLFRNPADRDRFILEVSDALTAAYGPTMKFDDTMSIFGIRITAEFDAWQDANQWYQAHTAIHTDHYDDIKRTVADVVTRFTAGLGTFDRLRVRYSGWEDRSTLGRIVRWFTVDIPIEYRYRVHNLKARLSKMLDKLLPKA
jgi:hypothetical protein